MAYSEIFLDALGRWQNGWRQNPVLRGTIATNLLREAITLPKHVRVHDGTPLYRKRNLYRREDRSELSPLFTLGILDEGSPTSWSMSVEFAAQFGAVFDDRSPNSVAGAIFRHVPSDEEVIISVPRLWDDPNFVKSAEQYRRNNGAWAKAIFHFRECRDQFEVILRAPLRAEEIYQLGRSTTLESLYQTVGAETDEAKSAVDGLLSAAGLEPHEPRYLTVEATRRVVVSVLQKWQARVTAWERERTPSRPSGRRGRLLDAFELGNRTAVQHAKFLGWRRLRGRGGLMEGRWSDGTVAYHGFYGRIWVVDSNQNNRV